MHTPQEQNITTNQGAHTQGQRNTNHDTYSAVWRKKEKSRQHIQGKDVGIRRFLFQAPQFGLQLHALVFLIGHFNIALHQLLLQFRHRVEFVALTHTRAAMSG